MGKPIGLIGCGWLGMPLAKILIARGQTVHGSTTSPDKLELLQAEGIEAFRINLQESGVEGPINAFLEGLQTLVINVPPKLRGPKKTDYVAKMTGLHEAVVASGITQVVFVSSTSVYGDTDGEVTENTPVSPVTESGRQLVAVENLLCHSPGLRTTIVRFGGLIGDDRHPVTHLAGKTGLKNGRAPINLIHQNDCIRIITSILSENWWNEVFNGVYPHHPPKAEYYRAEARKRGMQLPDYVNDSSISGKIVRSHNLQNVKGFSFTTTL